MTARDEALADLDRIDRILNSTDDTTRIRAALAPDLPADLAEIQARADADAARLGLYVSTAGWDRHRLLALAREQAAELAALRAAPRLTAEEAEALIDDAEEGGRVDVLDRNSAWRTLRAIAGQAKS